jgi:exosortase/archaeosortase family protein
MMKKEVNILLSPFKPYKGVAYFLLVLFATHFLWKWAVDADLHAQNIAIFGVDCTPFFYKISQFTAMLVYQYSRWFPGSETLCIEDTRLFFPDGKIALIIIWGCTGVKQLYIFLMILLFYPGPWKKKLWYIPGGCLILFAYNIVRISAILFLTNQHPERFEMLHEGLFRYIYYGIIFLLWVVWEERIRKKDLERKQNSNENKK